jgi:ribosome-binding protein aMBF1 (putative translation factor)
MNKPNDYEPVVFKKPVAYKAPSSTSCTKIEKELRRDDGEIPQLKYMEPSFVKMVVDARLARKWTRKFLASQLCVKESVVTEFESGHSMHNGHFISKLKHKLELHD